MGSKLGDNGIYEGSRMIMPEHREAYLNLMHEKNRREKPTLDMQEVQLIERAVIDSYNRRCTLDLVLFDPFDNEQVSGVVVSLNTATREIRLKVGDDYRWIKLSEIISANTIDLY